MKKFIQNWILHNLSYKIIALLVAIVVWVTFNYSNDPIKMYSVTATVNVEHADEYLAQGRYVEIDGTDNFSTLTETVYIRARSSVINALYNRNVSSYLNVYVDLYELDSNDANRLIIHYEISDPSLQAEIYSYKNKTYLSCEVEENVTKEVAVEYLISGVPASGYLYERNDANIQVTPATITLTGPENQLANVDHAQVNVNVANASANVNVTGKLTFRDAEGKTLTLSTDVVTTSATEASVFVPIYICKTVSILPYLSGSAPAGYEYTGDVSLDTTSISIYGPESVLNKVSSISLPEIALSEITGEYEDTFKLQDVLDAQFGKDTVRLSSGEAEEVTVTFSVGEQVEKTIKIPTSSIVVYGLGSGQTLTYEKDSIEITLFGLQETMDAFDQKNMSVVLRLIGGNYTPGSYVVSLEVSGLGGLQYHTVSVKITIAEPVAEETE